MPAVDDHIPRWAWAIPLAIGFGSCLSSGVKLPPSSATGKAASVEDQTQGPSQREVPLSFLERLGAAVGDARVVMLGETTHGGAATFDLKLDLVKYLHRELGFDRVVLEAGLFSCREANDALARGQTPSDAASLCLFERNFCFDGSFPLFEYALDSARQGHPLQLSGMDPQLSGLAPSVLSERLSQALGEPLPEAQLRAISNLRSLELVRSLEERTEDRMAILALSGRLRQRLGVDSFWAHVADGLLFLDADHWDYQTRRLTPIQMGLLREREMGQNLLWHIQKRPDEKVIVWVANLHGARTHEGLHNERNIKAGWPRHYSVPAGQWVAESLGAGYFALAISPASGHFGRSTENTRGTIGPARAGSVERETLDSGASARLLQKEELERRGRFEALPLLSPSLADWGKLFDAWIVLPEERAMTRRPDCSE